MLFIIKYVKDVISMIIRNAVSQKCVTNPDIEEFVKMKIIIAMILGCVCAEIFIRIVASFLTRGGPTGELKIHHTTRKLISPVLIIKRGDE